MRISTWGRLSGEMEWGSVSAAVRTSNVSSECCMPMAMCLNMMARRCAVVMEMCGHKPAERSEV
jgi:hypothetical protein